MYGTDEGPATTSRLELKVISVLVMRGIMYLSGLIIRCQSAFNFSRRSIESHHLPVVQDANPIVVRMLPFGSHLLEQRYRSGKAAEKTFNHPGSGNCAFWRRRTLQVIPIVFN